MRDLFLLLLKIVLNSRFYSLIFTWSLSRLLYDASSSSFAWWIWIRWEKPFLLPMSFFRLKMNNPRLSSLAIDSENPAWSSARTDSGFISS